MYLEEIAIKTGNWVDSAQDSDYWGACRVPNRPWLTPTLISVDLSS